MPHHADRQGTDTMLVKLHGPSPLGADNAQSSVAWEAEPLGCGRYLGDQSVDVDGCAFVVDAVEVLSLLVHEPVLEDERGTVHPDPVALRPPHLVQADPVGEPHGRRGPVDVHGCRVAVDDRQPLAHRLAERHRLREVGRPGSVEDGVEVGLDPALLEEPVEGPHVHGQRPGLAVACGVGDDHLALLHQEAADEGDLGPAGVDLRDLQRQLPGYLQDLEGGLGVEAVGEVRVEARLGVVDVEEGDAVPYGHVLRQPLLLNDVRLSGAADVQVGAALDKASERRVVRGVGLHALSAVLDHGDLVGVGRVDHVEQAVAVEGDPVLLVPAREAAPNAATSHRLLGRGGRDPVRQVHLLVGPQWVGTAGGPQGR
mmetsp:Transcript_44631/g.106700  ORF Transcript_44631/g.106700 Transcript_44631/m.106700 type:complete len:370 (+) Transcript_44631:118-1227(+)